MGLGSQQHKSEIHGEQGVTGLPAHPRFTNNNLIPTSNGQVAVAYSVDFSGYFAAPGSSGVFSVVGTLPTPLAIGATTGILAGTPDGGQNGTYPITIRLTNDAGVIDSNQFDLVIAA